MLNRIIFALTGMLCAVACAPLSTVLPLPAPAQAAIDDAPIAVADTKSALPPEWKRGPFMEIFVRAYADSDGDGIGDFRGLTSKLDYIQSLGIRGIWLMPVNPSEDRDHGYSVTDYRAIAPEHGTLADFDEFLKQAHARGIGVVMDYVVNHSASVSPLFKRATASKQSPYRDWYVWRDVAPTDWRLFGKNPWHTLPSGAYLGGFDHSMPDFNLLNPAVLDYHIGSLRFWLNRGVDGFRFDAVSHLVENGPNAMTDQPENFQILAKLRSEVERYDNRYIVCEATGASERYGAPEVFGSAFAFGLNAHLISAAKGDAAALQKVADYYVRNKNAGNMATFLANHDEFAGKRLADQFGADETGYKLAVTMLMTLPGVPFIYYGEEVGMNAGAGLRADPSLRSPMSWTANEKGFSQGKPFRALAGNVSTRNVAAQTNDATSLLNFYRELLQLRASTSALAYGNFGEITVEDGLVSMVRRAAQQTALVFINTGATTRTVKVGAGAVLWPKRGAAITGSGELMIAARAVVVIDAGASR